MTSSAAPRSTVTDPPAARRSLAPDIARGLMLALIAIANVSWFLWGHESSVGMSPHVPPAGAADSVVQILMTIAVDHRAMPLFAFLFGYGMVQFYRSRVDRGLTAQIVRRMMRRRHWAMLLLGLLHAALLFYGDILGAYAVGGLLLVWIFFGRRTRTLVVWIAVLVGIMALFALFSIVSALALVFFAPPEATAAMESSSVEMGFVRNLAYGQPYLVTILARLGFWLVGLLPMALVAAPVPILLGWLAARHRVLDEPWRHTRLLTRVAIGAIAFGWLGGMPDALTYAGIIPLPDEVAWAFSGLTALSGTVCGIGYAAAFGLLAARLEGRPAAPAPAAPALDRAARRLARRESAAAEAVTAPAARAYGVPAAHEAPEPTRTLGPVPRALSAVGQRSLTFYLFQSLLLAPLMAAWGLGLGGHLGTATAVAIAFGVWLLSLPLAALMDSRNLRGPAELLLRRMTYGAHDRSRPDAPTSDTRPSA
ncbi:DUF418 domain-containing protein [Brachybacterium sp. FME24]|uniref:DUF418 domain-containing protein n=1 Tax=Brachybacterium sp. FME24 TaxID=2742605 RepID=UPI00271481AC|nr:DUF418 domain-containing protein [Brachybacterium sp. FME24]